MQRLFADVHLVQRVTSGYSGAGGRFPAIWPQARNSARKRYFRAIVFGMPVSPIVPAIGSDGRATTRRAQRALLRRRLIARLSAAAEAKTGSEIGSLCRPAHGGMCCCGAGTGGGGLLPQTAASGNVSQPDPESFMYYPG